MCQIDASILSFHSIEAALDWSPVRLIMRELTYTIPTLLSSLRTACHAK